MGDLRRSPILASIWYGDEFPGAFPSELFLVPCCKTIGADCVSRGKGGLECCRVSLEACELAGVTGAWEPAASTLLFFDVDLADWGGVAGGVGVPLGAVSLPIGKCPAIVVCSFIWCRGSEFFFPLVGVFFPCGVGVAATDDMVGWAGRQVDEPYEKARLVYRTHAA